MKSLKFDAGLIAIGGFCALALIGVVAAAQVGQGTGMPMAMTTRPAAPTQMPMAGVQSQPAAVPTMTMTHRHQTHSAHSRAMSMPVAMAPSTASPSGGMQMSAGSPTTTTHHTTPMRMPARRGGGHARRMKNMKGMGGGDGMGGMNGGDAATGSSTLASANGVSLDWEPPQPGQNGRPSEGSALIVRSQNLPYEYGAHGGEEMHAMMNAPCSPTPDQQAAADRLYQQTNAVLRQYDNNPAKALADGFTDVVGPADRFVHMINWPRVFDNGTLNPAQIESFMYAMTDRGLTAVGGMYIMPAEFKDGKIVPKEPKHGPQIGGCLTRWHKHQGWVAGMTTAGSNWDETPEMLHVWTYPDLYPWGDYNGRQLAQLWKPWAGVPSVCRISEPYGTDICFP